MRSAHLMRTRRGNKDINFSCRGVISPYLRPSPGNMDVGVAAAGPQGWGYFMGFAAKSPPRGGGIKP